jgi:hypothetical protein
VAGFPLLSIDGDATPSQDVGEPHALLARFRFDVDPHETGLVTLMAKYSRAVGAPIREPRTDRILSFRLLERHGRHGIHQVSAVQRGPQPSVFSMIWTNVDAAAMAAVRAAGRR